MADHSQEKIFQAQPRQQGRVPCDFKNYIDRLERIVQRIGKTLPEPKFEVKSEGVIVRHLPQDRTDVLMCHLKITRNMSLLRAAVCLLENGFVQENYILCRLIEEATEDITFLSLPSLEADTPKHKQRLVNEFFQEELSDLDDSLSSIPRDRVPRKKIHAVTAKHMAQFQDPHTVVRHLKSMHQLLSGFVHGAYVFIMELYMGFPGSFHTQGLKGTIRMEECEENFPNHLLRVIYSAEIVAHRLGRSDLVLEALKLGCAFAKETACMPEEGIAQTERRIAALSSQ